MRITIAQLQVNRELARNRERIVAILESAHPSDWIAFPEGMLSGYFPGDANFTRSLDDKSIEEGIRQIHQLVIRKRCNCLLGSVVFTQDHWYNSVLVLSSSGQRYTYHKMELSALDRRHFFPGESVVPYELDGIPFGVQACRELLFPKPWIQLKEAGSRVVFHINNAIQRHDAVWNHVLIARAIEQSVFVCSVNNAAPPQTLASYLIGPSGNVILKTDTQCDQVLSAEIDLNDAIPDLTKRQDY